MRRIRGNYDDSAGFNLACFIADCDGGAAIERERNLDVRMFVQKRALSGLGLHDVGRERRALFFTNEFVRHSDKWQLLDI